MNKKLPIFLMGMALSPLALSEEAPTNVYWGDTHLHTSLSFDSYTFGSKGTPETAYRYSLGYPVIHPTLGSATKIDEPLDFLIIADHAETLGAVQRLLEGEAPEIEKTKMGQYILDIAGERTQHELDGVYNALNLIGSGMPNDSGLTGLDLVKALHGENIRTAWDESVIMADKYNDPGKFTAMIGWEWTSQPGGANFHRVIFTPDDSTKARQYLPYSTLESDDPEKLWEFLAAQEKASDTEFLTIPHGSNISNGLMFGLNRRNGEPIDREYAEKKRRYETAIEITQIKGDSEAHPMFSPEDEFADFEPYNFLSSPTGDTPEPQKGDYVRSGFRNGLELEAKIGMNPYKMGIAAGTDSHTGIPQITEEDFGGKSGHDSKPADRPKPSGIGSSKGWDMGAAGFTGVWAKENTRREIFEAFRRQEVYATTGPRITLRFFGGFDLEEKHADAKNFAKNGYKYGVPMGADLDKSKAKKGKAPKFTIAALKATKGANLDRVQIVKGWLNADGTSSEKVYDVALSDGRTSGETPVGNTVNMETGEYTNDIGDAELRTFWQDPDFDADQAAFYYVRVLEIPTPRYSLYNAIALGIDPAETGRDAVIQERAYSSPIWYGSK
ncbi:DUF3604 domain-containing protein [Thalassotalea sp. PLHSN55]|uniref:DUF3604 domain-containing protein n=1 Tax=Thalassotalea sp. PLHSN55 TaxID=3435888 RepID=UPI003F858CBE